MILWNITLNAKHNFCLNLPSFDSVLSQKPFLKNGSLFLCLTALFLISVLMHQKDSRIKNEDSKEINFIPVHGFLLKTVLNCCD